MSKTTKEAVITYSCNGQDRGDIILEAEDFMNLFGFEPKDDEVYNISLYVTNNTEGGGGNG